MGERSRACSGFSADHDACDGYVTVIDQDGHSTYICDCYCHAKFRTVKCPTCDGKGKIQERFHAKTAAQKKAADNESRGDE